MATNEILPFATTDTGANQLTQANYQADAQRPIGNQPGVARQMLVNKVLKQVSVVAAGLAQYIADRQVVNVTDLLSAANFASYLENAIGSVYAPKNTPNFTGNVGIGVAGAASAIAIQRGAGQIAYIEVAGNANVPGSTSMLYGQDSANAGYVWNRANASVIFATNGVERARITGNGALGIGTPTPTAKLSVEDGSTSNTEVASFTNSNTGGTVRTAIKLGYVGFGYGARIVAEGNPSAVNPASLVFERGTGTGYTETMRIDQGGNVYPFANGTQNLGMAANRWGTIYGAVGAFTDASVTGGLQFSNATAGDGFLAVDSGRTLRWRNGNAGAPNWSVMNFETGYGTFHNDLRSDTTITCGVAGAGTVAFAPGGAAQTGYINFTGPNGVRNGYIGFGNTWAGADTAGAINYTAGSHNFNGPIVGNLTGNATTASNAIGVDQTWQAFAGIKFGGTTYTSPVGRSIMINVELSGGDGAWISITVGGALAAWSGNERYSGTRMVSAIIPPNTTYVVGGSIGRWYELR